MFLSLVLAITTIEEKVTGTVLKDEPSSEVRKHHICYRFCVLYKWEISHVAIFLAGHVSNCFEFVYLQTNNGETESKVKSDASKLEISANDKPEEGPGKSEFLIACVYLVTFLLRISFRNNFLH